MIYPGTKSLDAEIYIDFLDGTVKFDYLSNRHFSEYDSNTSESNDETNEWLKLPLYKQISIKSVHDGVFAINYMLADAVIQKVVTFLQHHSLFPESWQYPYQCHMKETQEWFNGYYIEKLGGELNGTVLQIPVSTNVYVEYKLSGEYKSFIKSISFKRRIRRLIKYGKYPVDEQDGWLLTFVFKSQPKEGSVIVRYT